MRGMPDDPGTSPCGRNRGGDALGRADRLPGPGVNSRTLPSNFMAIHDGQIMLVRAQETPIRALWTPGYSGVMQKGDPGTPEHPALIGYKPRTLRSGQALAPVRHLP